MMDAAMPIKLVKDADGEPRLSFTLSGILVLIVWVVVQVAALAGLYYSLKQLCDLGIQKAETAQKAADLLNTEKASKDDVKHLIEADTAFESRLKRAEDENGKQLAEIRSDVKQILRDMPRTK